MRFQLMRGLYRVQMTTPETAEFLKKWPEFSDIKPDCLTLFVRRSDHQVVIVKSSRVRQDIPAAMIKLIAARAKRSAERALKLA